MRPPPPAAVLFLMLLTSACSQSHIPDPILFPPPPATTRLAYLGRLDEVPIDRPIRGALLRWLYDPPTFLQAPMLRPFGLAARGQRLYACDATGGRVLVFDYADQRTHQIDGLTRPVAVALAPDGHAWVADATGRLSEYDADLRPIRWIEAPTGPFRPAALSILDDVLFVADVGSGSVRRYDLSRRAWLDGPITLADPRALPAGLAHAGRRLWIVDALNGTCWRLDPGGTPEFVAGAGELVRPKHLAADRAGRLLIADAARQVLQVRDPEGSLLMEVADPAVLPLPTGVCVSYELLEHYAKRIPPGMPAAAIVFASNQSGPPGVALFAWAPGPDADGEPIPSSRSEARGTGFSPVRSGP